MGESIYKSGAYWEQNRTYHVEDSPWKAKQIVRMLDKHKLRPLTVCEIGCGAGEILRQLSGHLPGAALFGYDISPEAIQVAKERENDRLHFFRADPLERQTQQFDLLLCMDVIEHIDDYLGFLRKMLPLGKFALFHIPLDMTVQGMLFRRTPLVMRNREALGHLHYFMKETALATLEDTGYQIVDWSYTFSGELGGGFKRALAAFPKRLVSLLHTGLAARLFAGFSLLVLARRRSEEGETTGPR